MPCAWSGRSSTASGPPASWACSRWVKPAWRLWPTLTGSCSAIAVPARPAVPCFPPLRVSGRCWSRSRLWSGRRSSPAPRRSAQGVDGGRLALVLAVLEQRAGVALGALRCLLLRRGRDQGGRAGRRSRPRPGLVLRRLGPRPSGRCGGVRRGGARGRDPPGAPRPAPAGRGGSGRIPPCARAGVVPRRPRRHGGRPRVDSLAEAVALAGLQPPAG